jgi:hypothetical protein
LIYALLWTKEMYVSDPLVFSPSGLPYDALGVVTIANGVCMVTLQLHL